VVSPVLLVSENKKEEVWQRALRELVSYGAMV